MGKIEFEKEKKILHLLDSCDVEAAFALLSEHHDLRQAELPPVDKKILQKIALNRSAVRTVVLGLCSPEPTIRRFARKYLPKIGEPAAVDLLFLMAETLDPLRTVREGDHSLFGSFGGYASPAGQAIKERKMKLTVREPQIYSEASKYLNQVLADCEAVLRSVRFDYFWLLFEYYCWRNQFDEGAEIDGDGDSEPSYIYTTFGMEARYLILENDPKGHEKAFEALKKWAQGDLFLEDENSMPEPLKPLCRRFLSRGDALIQRVKIAVQLQAVYAMGRLPKDMRIEIYKTAAANRNKFISEMGNTERNRFEYAFTMHLRQYPNEIKDAAQEARMKHWEEQREKLLKGKHKVEPMPAHLADAVGEIVEIEAAAPAVEKKIFGLRVEEFKDRLDELSHYFGKEAALLPSMRTFAKKYRANQNKDKRNKNGEETIIPEDDLKSAEWIEPFYDMLLRLAAPIAERIEKKRREGGIPGNDNYEAARTFYMETQRGLEILLLAAVAILPEEHLKRSAQYWNDISRGIEIWGHTPQQIVENILDTRDLLAVDLLVPIFSSPRMISDKSCQTLAAIYYGRKEPECREAVLKIISSISVEAQRQMYARDGYYKPFQWLIHQAWKNRDSELLALALARCAVPFFGKGASTFLPCVEEFEIREKGYSYYTINEVKGSGSLAEVWDLVRQREPQILPEIVNTALQEAEHRELPRALLPIIAEQDPALLAARVSDLIEILESAQSAVIIAGYETISKAPQIVGEHVPQILQAAERSFSSTSAGIAKAAASMLGKLAAAYPEKRDEIAGTLAAALFGEADATLEQVMKSLKKALPCKISEEARERIMELGKSDPRRFKKLSEELIAGIRTS